MSLDLLLVQYLLDFLKNMLCKENEVRLSVPEVVFTFLLNYWPIQRLKSCTRSRLTTLFVSCTGDSSSFRRLLNQAEIRRIASGFTMACRLMRKKSLAVVTNVVNGIPMITNHLSSNPNISLALFISVQCCLRPCRWRQSSRVFFRQSFFLLST